MAFLSLFLADSSWGQGTSGSGIAGAILRLENAVCASPPPRRSTATTGSRTCPPESTGCRAGNLGAIERDGDGPRGAARRAGDRAIVNPAGDAGKGSDVMALENSGGATAACLALDPTAHYIRARAGAYPNAGRNTLPLAGASADVRAMFYNAANHPQFTPGSPNTVRAVPRPAVRNNLIPGDPLFHDPAAVYESNAGSVILSLHVQF